MKILKKHKGLWITLLGICILVLLLFLFMRSRGSAAAQSQNSTGSATVQTGTITDTVSGTGNLTGDGSISVRVPAGLTVEEVYVEAGDTVLAGDPLAVFDAASVQSQISTVQDQLNTLDSEIQAAEDQENSTTITSSVDGRVKAIYANESDDVAETVLENGSLMLISLDGLMAVHIKTDAVLNTGEEVIVELSNGEQISGTAEWEQDCWVITLSDNGPLLGEEVSIYNQDDTYIGSGNLEIHQLLTITGVSGTVDYVHVSDNSLVSAGASLFTISDAGSSPEYLALLKQRESKTEALYQLLVLTQNNYVLLATADGTIEQVLLTDATASTSSTSTASDSSVRAMTTSSNAGGTSVSLLSSNPEATAESPAPVENIDSLAGLTLTQPVTGATPQSAINGGTAYSGTVHWTPQAEQFVPGTTYTATVTLTATESYAFTQSAVDSLGNLQLMSAGATLLHAGLDQAGSGNTLTFVVQYSATEDVDDTGDTTPSGNSSAGSYTAGGSGGYTSGSHASGSSSSNSGYSSGSAAVSGNSAVTPTEQTGSTNGETSESDMIDAFTISSGDRMSLNVSVDELDILSLEVGQKSVITLDALEGEVLEGEIARVNKTGTSSDGVTKYTVEIQIPKEEFMLSGMSASATIAVSQAEDVLLIPAEALQESGGRTYVFTDLDSNGAAPTSEVDVVTGLSDGVYVEIVSGLKTGETVYYNRIVDTSGSTSSGMGGGMGGMGSAMSGGSGGE